MQDYSRTPSAVRDEKRDELLYRFCGGAENYPGELDEFKVVQYFALYYRWV